MKDCPSTRAFIAAPDDSEDEGEAIDSAAATKDLPSLLVQRVLTSKAEMRMRRKSNARICSTCFSKLRIVVFSP